MKTRIIIIVCIAFVSHFVLAQDSTYATVLPVHERTSRNHDYLMPGKGKSMVEFYSGIPYVALGLYSYGVSERFSLGVFYGYTPDVLGYGLRIKAVVAQPSESVRINFKVPLIYYPRMSKEVAEPWVLAWPTLSIEKKMKNEARLWVGMGVIGAACVDYLTESADEDPDEESEAEIWNTIQIGYSKPLSDKWSFVVEVAPVMKGFKFTTPHGLVNNLPAFATVGLSYTL